MSPKQLVVALTLALGLPAWAATPSAEEDLLGRTVFQVLLGELALREGAVDLSVQAWADLAERTRDPKVLSRAVEIAGFAGDNVRALQLVRLWLEVEPESSTARQSLVALLIQTRQLDQLRPHLANLLEADKENLANNLLHLNRMLARITDKAGVLDLLDSVLAGYRELPEAHFALAQAALAANDTTRALAETEQALRLRPDWEAAAIAHAKLLGRSNASTGIDDLARFVKRYPNARDARLALGQMLVAEKRLDEARQQYQRLLKDYPDEPSVLYPAAILALQAGDRDSGRQQLTHLLETDYPDKSGIHYLLGQIAQEAGQPDQAIGHFRQVTAGERYIAARSRVAILLLSQGKRDEAIALLRQTRGATPGERTQLALAEAQLLRESGDEAGAYAALEKALLGAPNDPELLYDAALTAERLGRHDAMETRLRHLLKLHPEHPHALNALGYSYADRNIRLDEAAVLLTQAIALAPEDAFIMDSVGWLQYRQGKLAEALTTLQNAYQLKADPEIAAHLGEVLWQLDRRDEARKVWQDARSQHPGNAALNAVIQKFLP
ncbi:tetratricopeptide repeat protein [Azonexus hydrophilus]|uniref:tetratricopeptide repeat protein n=1 Tax=Azonexus hydrophilus TaxID=418702 RepID=UPI00042A83B2|nr:tetratricopeptide repeat protein [Azonexus hydrophilus]